MSDPEDGLPAWIEMRWDEPVTIGSVQLVFDTGLHRLLTQSGADNYTAKMQWGRPQEETVRDYTVSVGVDASEEIVVTDNYQRMRRHSLAEPVRTNSLRIDITSAGTQKRRLKHGATFPEKCSASPVICPLTREPAGGGFGAVFFEDSVGCG